MSRLLAGLRDYSPIASLLDSRLLQLKDCSTLIRLNTYITELPIVPASQGQTISEIEVRFVDRNNQPVAGRTKPHIIFRLWY